MSYAGPASRNRGSSPSTAPSLQGSSRPQRPSGGPSGASSGAPDRHERDDETGGHETDWQQIAIFGAGLALGLALGAGAALLAAPQTGEETRAALSSRARRIKRTTSRRSRNAWSELGDELRGAANSLRRRRARRAAQKELDRESGEA